MISKRHLVVVKREVEENQRSERGRRFRNVLVLLLLFAFSWQWWFLFKSQNHNFSSIGGSDLGWSMVSSFSGTAKIVNGVEWTRGAATENDLRPQHYQKTMISNSSSLSPSLRDGGGICSVAQSSASPQHVWGDHLQQIFQHSRHPKDGKNQLGTLTRDLLWTISPRLPLSIANLPRDHAKVQGVLEKIWNRYQFLQLRNNYTIGTTDVGKDSEPPIVQITVLGGSVAMGINCYTQARGVRIGNCAWPYQLESTINNLAGGKLVSVANHATGGTNSRVGATILKYELLPDSSRVPDILINAYSTNDMHILSMKEAKEENSEMKDHLFAIQQDFIRTAITTMPCGILIFLDDYLGNEQREILATTLVGQTMRTLANYYGFGTVSYSNMIRDIVYKDTFETTFSPAGWYKFNADGVVQDPNKMSREIHPGYGMHKTVAWAVTYYLLAMGISHCGIALTLQNSGDLFGAAVGDKEEKTQRHHQMFPNPFTTNAMPPLLTPTFSLEDVSREWNQSIQEEEMKNSHIMCLGKAENLEAASGRCAFSWLSTLALRSEHKEHDWVVNFFEPYLVVAHENENPLSSSLLRWDVVDAAGRNPKPGWSPIDKTKDLFQLKFPIQVSTTTVTVFYMKSYGPKWERSTCEVKVSSSSSSSYSPQPPTRTEANNPADVVATEMLEGFHDKQTSEIYTTEIIFSNRPIDPPSSVMISFRLVSGETFKIMGLTVCG